MIAEEAAEEPSSATPTVTVGEDASAAVQAWAPGEIVCDRFLVTRLLGRGGIGEVYEAVDQMLGTRVALKILRPSWSADPRAGDSLRQEVLLARQVTHPNVCRTFDVFQHQGGFVIGMERIEGRSLAEILRRQGPYPPSEALELLRQVASGLDAAHQAGIVHRDLKAANVLVTTGTARPRAAITDFGQAVVTSEGAGASGAGTPPYIAPEVLKGEPASPAADLYSFGVLMLELVSGKRPTSGIHQTTSSTALSTLLADRRLPKAWRQTIARLTAGDPSQRPKSAREALAALEGSRSTSRLRLRRAASWLASATTVTAAFLVGSQLVPPPAEPTAPATPLRTVGFLPLDDSTLSEDRRGLASGLGQLLEGELAAGGSILVRTAAETSEGVDARTASATLASLPEIRRLAEDFGCEVMIRGAVTPASPEADLPLELVLYLVPVSSSGPQNVLRRTGSLDELMGAIPEIADELRHALGTPPLARGERTRSPGRPANTAALLFYGRGLESLRRYDPGAARGFFERSAAADPEFALTHAGLADTLLMLGDSRSARASSERAVLRSRHLRREQRLAIEAIDHVARENWPAAAEIYRALGVFFPHNPSFLRHLAQAELTADRPVQALVAIEALRAAALGAADLAHADLLAAQAANLKQDFVRQLELTERVLAGPGAEQAPMIRAGALRERGGALHALGRSADARRDLEEARSLYRSQGNLGAYAEASNQLANLIGDLGDAVRAGELYLEALELFRQTGSERREARVMSNLSVLAYNRGQAAEAERLSLEALTIARRIGYRRLEGAVLNNLALQSLSSGRLPSAVARLEESLVVAREVGNRVGEVNTLANLAGPYLSLGQLTQARRAAAELDRLAHELQFAAGEVVAAVTNAGLAVADRDLRTARTELGMALEANAGLEDLHVRSFVLQADGDLAHLEGDLALARRQFEQARQTAETAGDPLKLALALLGQSRVALAEGQGEEALRLAREARRNAARAKSALDGARAEVAMAEAFLKQKKVELAASALKRAEQLCQDGSNLEIEVIVRLGQARLAAAQGRLEAALERLRPLRELARTSGFSHTYFEAALLEVEVLLRLDQRSGATTLLAEVERQAREGGFGLFEAKIRRLIERSL